MRQRHTQQCVNAICALVKHDNIVAMKSKKNEAKKNERVSKPEEYMKKEQNSLSEKRVRQSSRPPRCNTPMSLMNSIANEFKTMSIGLLAPNTIHKLMSRQNDSIKSSAHESIRQATPMLLPNRNKPRRLKSLFVDLDFINVEYRSVDVLKARLR